MSQPTFDLDVLRSFVLGTELGNFAKAAERLGRSTSAVSAQLKKLEDQVGVAVLRKSGRGMVLTPAGESLFGYAKRLLALNEEAAVAVRGADLHGTVRVGLQEDFAENLLSVALGSFARAHSQIHIEAHLARHADLLDNVHRGRLDLALAWDVGKAGVNRHFITALPMCWIGAADWRRGPATEPLPLVALEAPCLMRSAALTALERDGFAWRPACTSPSLSGIWAAVSGGLGVTVRTPFGLPPYLRVLPGLPVLPTVGLSLHWAESEPAPLVRRLGEILLEKLAVQLRLDGQTVNAIGV